MVRQTEKVVRENSCETENWGIENAQRTFKHSKFLISNEATNYLNAGKQQVGFPGLKLPLDRSGGVVLGTQRACVDSNRILTHTHTIAFSLVDRSIPFHWWTMKEQYTYYLLVTVQVRLRHALGYILKRKWQKYSKAKARVYQTNHFHDVLSLINLCPGSECLFVSW